MGFIKSLMKFFLDIFKDILVKVITFGILILIAIFAVKHFLGINFFNPFG